MFAFYFGVSLERIKIFCIFVLNFYTYTASGVNSGAYPTGCMGIIKTNDMKDERILEISACQLCPFCNNDNEFGYDGCNLDGNILPINGKEMPEEHIHPNCPLNNYNFTICQTK